MNEDKLIINIKIGDRSYPIRIDRDDNRREELIRKASTSIEKAISKQQEKGYQNSDIQDYMAMVLMEFAFRLMIAEEKEDIVPIINELKKINFSLEKVLNKE